MRGAPEPLYVLARRTLLDTLEALGDQRQAIVLVGAQAVYLHTGETEFAVAPFTTDADLAVDPSALLDEPRLRAALESAGLRAGTNPGIWTKPSLLGTKPIDVEVDLLVPASLGGKGRRGADLGAHGREVARKATGLEAALEDCSPMTLSALDEADPRRIEVRVAGPTALLVAKLHKISDRLGSPREGDKDALDVLRILRARSTEELAATLRRLSGGTAATATVERALQLLGELFSTAGSPGSVMAARAAEPDPGDVIRASCAALASRLLANTRRMA